MAHPKKRNEAEDWKRLRRTLKRSQLRKARIEAEKARKEGKGGGVEPALNSSVKDLAYHCEPPLPGPVISPSKATSEDDSQEC